MFSNKLVSVTIYFSVTLRLCLYPQARKLEEHDATYDWKLNCRLIPKSMCSSIGRSCWGLK